jgi:hypothetical protein
MAKNQIMNLKFNVLGNGIPNYNEIISNPYTKKIILNQTRTSLKNAINKRLKSAKILEINSSGHYMSVDKCDYSKVIDTLIKYYECEENYEECASLLNLKSKI